MDIIEASTHRLAWKRIKNTVLPVREQKAHEEVEINARVLAQDPRAPVNLTYQQSLEIWWKHTARRELMMRELEKLSRYVVCSRVTKRPIFEFARLPIHPSDLVQVFAFDDDYTFGILQSALHWAWFTEKGSTLTERYRYTPHSVFDTFTFPQSPPHAQVKAVADAARALHEWRRERMAKSEGLTLRRMYQSLEQPGKNPLKELHEALNRAVYAAYDFNLHGNPLAQLLALNRAVHERIQAGEPVTPPGIPADYPNPAELVTEGCIQPPELI